jgi:hypothetical protein
MLPGFRMNKLDPRWISLRRHGSSFYATLDATSIWNGADARHELERIERPVLLFSSSRGLERLVCYVLPLPGRVIPEMENAAKCKNLNEY